MFVFLITFVSQCEIHIDIHTYEEGSVYLSKKNWNNKDLGNNDVACDILWFITDEFLIFELWSLDTYIHEYGCYFLGLGLPTYHAFSSNDIHIACT